MEESETARVQMIAAEIETADLRKVVCEANEDDAANGTWTVMTASAHGVEIWTPRAGKMLTVNAHR